MESLKYFVIDMLMKISPCQVLPTVNSRHAMFDSPTIKIRLFFETLQILLRIFNKYE